MFHISVATLKFKFSGYDAAGRLRRLVTNKGDSEIITFRMRRVSWRRKNVWTADCQDNREFIDRLSSWNHPYYAVLSNKRSVPAASMASVQWTCSQILFTNPLAPSPLDFTTSPPKQKHSHAKSRLLRRLKSKSRFPWVDGISFRWQVKRIS